MSIRVVSAVAGGAIASSFVLSEYIRRTYGETALPRMLTAYSVAVPALVEYKTVQILREQLPAKLGMPVDEERIDAMYDELHLKWAPRMLDVIHKLRGFNLKSGQMVASNFGNAFPELWQKTFSPLLDRVPHKPFEVVRATIQHDLGRNLEDVYSYFEEEPIAAASIGQVHRARLREGGTHVVVKVQYPEVESQFRGDIHAARVFLQAALPEHLPAIDEIEKQFANEFDYRREAAQLALIRSNLARAGSFKDIIVPAPILDLCTKSVLTMTEVPRCEKLTTALQTDMQAFADSRGITLEQLMAEEKALNKAALARGELRCGAEGGLMDTYIRSITWRNTFRWMVGLPPLHVPLNHARLIDELFRVHGHEVLVDGAFNGDPHPGNLLVTRDPTHTHVKLALVDYGQVKHLTVEQRVKVARLLVALARCDEHNAGHRRTIARLINDMGLQTEKNDPDVLFQLARLFFDRDDVLTTRGKNTQAYIEEVTSKDALKQVGDDYVLVARCSLMLRGLGHMLNQHRSAAKAWQGLAEKVLQAADEDPDKILG